MDVTVAAVMTAPRYECVSARSRIEASLAQSGVPLTISGGVFYGQCMQNMMEGLVGKVDYILTVDFDSMFLPSHVLRLLSIIAQEEEVDALASMQAKRGEARMLASRQTDNEIIWDGMPVRVDTAHFGLTVLDARKLGEVEKPWFICQPDANGSWGDDRVDSDVWFWRQWARAGHGCFIDPGCRIGHLEELVTVFDENMQPQHLYPSKWQEIAGETCLSG